MVKAGISGAEWSREAAAFSVIERIAPRVWRVVENDAHESELQERRALKDQVRETSS